ncbi:recombination protein NinB [Marinomonas sp. CT5]|uniref:recombination protein NinB n=1 Tax=Marinomonas sp. CT5 TaxID=2066133 RepID=UPI001BAFB1E1|nr:recombination protein NinB [Marinomonas sp. CT5]
MKAAKSDITIEIKGEDDLRTKMIQAWELVCKGIKANEAKGPVILKLGRKKRNNGQNARLWATLTDVSTQLEWYGEKLSQEDWKHVFTAALKKQKAVPGIDGGFVVLATHTSTMNKTEFSELFELIYAFGSERGVRWSDPVMKYYEQMGLVA